MVSSSHTPPAKTAMTDQELNEAVASLQMQPDGLVAAMALIESQTQLREQDARNFLIWESENRIAIAEEQRLAEEQAQAKKIADELEAQRLIEQQEARRAAAELEAQMLAERLAVQRLADEEAARQAQVQAQAQAQATAEANRLASEEAARQAVAQAEAESQRLATEEATRLAQEQAQNELIQTETTEASTPINEDPVAFLNANYGPSELANETGTKGPPETELDPQVNQNFIDMVFADAEAENQVAMVAVAVPAQPLEAPEAAKQEKKEPATKVSGLVWSWLSVAASPLILLFVAQLKVTGASYTQAIILMSAVILVSAAMASFGAVSSKRAGSSLVFVSRATFGVWGNLLPAVIVLIIKLFWLGAFALLSAKIISPLIFSQPWFDTVSKLVPVVPVEILSVLVVLIPLFAVGAVIAGFGGSLMLRTQQSSTVISIIGLFVVSGFVLSSYSATSLSATSLLATVELVDLVLLGIVTFAYPAFIASGDFARKLPGDTPGPKVFFVSFISLLVAPLAVSALGIGWFYLESDGFAQVALDETLSGVAGIAPIWAFVAFTVSIGISVLQLTSTLLYSGVQSLKSIGSKLHPSLNQLILAMVGIGLAVATVGFVLLADQGSLVKSLLLTSSIILASWIGIVLADALLRKVGYHEVSLTRSYGFYGRFNFVNFSGFIVASTLGFGYISNDGPFTSWQGFLLRLTPELSQFTGNYIGIVMAFGLALLVPVLFGIPRIRKQEHALLELESRRQELRQFLDSVE